MKKLRLINTEDRLVVTRGEKDWAGWEEWLKGSKKYKLPVLKEINPGGIMYSMKNIVNYINFVVT